MYVYVCTYVSIYLYISFHYRYHILLSSGTSAACRGHTIAYITSGPHAPCGMDLVASRGAGARARAAGLSAVCDRLRRTDCVPVFVTRDFFIYLNMLVLIMMGNFVFFWLDFIKIVVIRVDFLGLDRVYKKVSKMIQFSKLIPVLF